MNESGMEKRISCIGCWGLLPDTGERRCSKCGRPYDPADRGSYYEGVLRWYVLIDLHLVAFLLVSSPIIFVLSKFWILIPVVVLLPQGLILTHWTDLCRHHTSERKRNTVYLWVNEAVILIVAAIVFWLYWRR